MRARVGYMPEHDCLPPDLSAAEFVTHMGRISGLPRTAARERASEALRHVGLYEERYRPIGGYSTGMKQRVKLAQALVHDPDLLLLDEPTNGLDPAGRDAMLDLIRRIGTEFGISVVVCSHLLGEVERICDHAGRDRRRRLLRADTVSAMTTGQRRARRRGRGEGDRKDVLVQLATLLTVSGLSVRRDGQAAAGAAGRAPTSTTGSSARSPSWTCRCTGWTSAGTGSRSCSNPDPRWATTRWKVSAMSQVTDSVIHDIGYQRYTGARLGRGYAVWSLYVHSLRTAFGLGPERQGQDLPVVDRRLITMVAAVITAIVSSRSVASPS